MAQVRVRPCVHALVRARWAAVLLPLLVAAFGCNALIGADSPTLREADRSAGCVLNSDCTGADQVCIFRVCSPPCHADADCSVGSRCLQTSNGTACVANASASCDLQSTCPAGAMCQGGACRNACAQGCLSLQACVGGVCVGTDPLHDPRLDAGVPDGSVGASPPDAADGAVSTGPTEDATTDGPQTIDATFDANGNADASSGPGEAAVPNEAGICSAGAHQCNGQEWQTCTGGAWMNSGSACAFVCDPTAGCQGACTPGATRCMNNGVQTCGTDGTWGAAQPCAYVCVAGTTAQCGGQCVPGTMQCMQSIPQTCGSEGTWVSGAACPFVCSAGACAGSCAQGAMQCSDSTPQTCANGVWTNGSPCPFVCSGGMCTGSCLPNDTQCSSGTQQQTCNASGQWGNATPCAYVCSGKTCGGVCAPTTTQCSSGAQQTCDATGHWGTAVTCPYVCSGTTCGGVCVPGTTQCTSSTQQQICNAMGQWATATTCADACVGTGVGSACGGSCVPNSTQCVNSTQQQLCSMAGQWETATTCADACVGTGVGSKCGGVCVPMSTMCSGSAGYETCNAMGQWGTTMSVCPPSQVCRGTGCVNALEDIGYASTLSGSFSLFAGILYVFKLPALAHNATLLTFGTYGNASGADAKLALYADNGSGTAPAAFVSAVAGSLALVNGQKEQTASPTAMLSQGATYWLGIVVDANTTIYAQSDAASVGIKVSESYGAVPPWPSPAPGGVAVTPASDLAIYISVQDLN